MSTQASLTMCAVPRRILAFGDENLDGEDGAPAIAIAGGDGAAHRLDEAAADSEAEPGAGALPVLRMNAIEFVEDALEIGDRNTLSLVLDAEHDGGAFPARRDAHQRVRRCVF